MAEEQRAEHKVEDDDFGADLYNGADLLEDDEELLDPDDEEAGIDENLLGGSPVAEAPALSQDAPSGTAPIPTYGASSSSQAFRNTGPMNGEMGQQSHSNDVSARPRPGEVAEEGKMFIGGLNWETTDDTLRSYFGQYGAIESSTIMRDPAGRSRGFAFLTFEDPASVNAVVAKDHLLDGKMIDPKRAVPRAEHLKSQKVFVGGLAPSVTNASLKDFFSQYGTVMDAHIMLDRETSRSKGFAFVTFAEEADVQRAMGATGLTIEGRHIEVKRAQPRNAREGPSSLEQRGGDQYNGNSQYSSIGGYGPRAGMMSSPQMAGSSISAGMGLNAPYGMPMNQGMQINPMMANQGLGGMGGGFDPQSMAIMYQRMMMMMNPAALGMMSMGMTGGMQTNTMNPASGIPYNGGLINPAMMGVQSLQAGASPSATMGRTTALAPAPTQAAMVAPPVNAPRGPAAMRSQPAAPAPGGPARNSTQGQARSRPY